MSYFQTILSGLAAGTDNLPLWEETAPPNYQFYQNDFPHFFHRAHIILKERGLVLKSKETEEHIRRICGPKLEEYIKECKRIGMNAIIADILNSSDNVALLQTLFNHRQNLFVLENYLRQYRDLHRPVLIRLAQANSEANGMFSRALKLCQGEKLFARGLINEFNNLVRLSQKLINR